jgi:hypothetical protein
VVGEELGQVAGPAAGEDVDGVGDLGGRVAAEHGEHGHDVLGQPAGQARPEEPLQGVASGTGTNWTGRPLSSDTWAATSEKVIASGPVSS